MDCESFESVPAVKSPDAIKQTAHRKEKRTYQSQLFANHSFRKIDLLV